MQILHKPNNETEFLRLKELAVPKAIEYFHSMKFNGFFVKVSLFAIVVSFSHVILLEIFSVFGVPYPPNSAVTISRITEDLSLLKYTRVLKKTEFFFVLPIQPMMFL
jgi:hypothetical protein